MNNTEAWLMLYQRSNDDDLRMQRTLTYEGGQIAQLKILRSNPVMTALVRDTRANRDKIGL